MMMRKPPKAPQPAPTLLPPRPRPCRNPRQPRPLKPLPIRRLQPQPSLPAPPTPAPARSAMSMASSSKSARLPRLLLPSTSSYNNCPCPMTQSWRTTALSGHVSLDGGESAIHIDLHSLASDSSYRDRYIRQRMFPNSPTGTFTVQGLNELPAGFTDGDTVSAQIDGDLTIGSVTAPLTFDVEARDDGNASPHPRDNHLYMGPTTAERTDSRARWSASMMKSALRCS